MFSALPQSGHPPDGLGCPKSAKPEAFYALGHVPLAQWFRSVTAYHRRAAPCMRIKHLFTCRSQYHMHLLLFTPLPGLAHLPTQFVN
jgi:hypothetical protein